MTIQKRLFISNILMIMIPALLALLLLAGSLLVFLTLAFPNSEYELGSPGELSEKREEAVQLASHWLAETQPDQRTRLEEELSGLLAEHQMTLQLKDSQELVLQAGAGDLPSSQQQKLEQSLAALDGSGTVSDGKAALFGAKLLLDGEEYQLHLYNPVVSLSHDNLKIWAVVVGLFLVVILLFAVFFTNRFLTRFVFDRIAQPLKILAEGVHQIRDGNLTHRIVYSDADEFRPVCEDFNDMAQRLRDSVARLQKEEENRKELLAGISHDIRSPLTAIRAYVEGLLDGVADTPQRQRAYLSTIQKKTMEMDQMVRKLFLFSKMDLGEYPYHPEYLDAVEEITEFVQVSQEEYRRRGLAIQFGPLPQQAVVLADPTYFRSVLINLLDNSAKYKNKEQGCATISGKVSHQQLFLYVDDDGPGVPPKALPKLFDVFYRNDPSRKNPKQGSGLGLAIVWKAVERMTGAIHAENLPQGGLRMAIQIPLAERGQQE